jgi:hypothetical protein
MPADADFTFAVPPDVLATDVFTFFAPPDVPPVDDFDFAEPPDVPAADDIGLFIIYCSYVVDLKSLTKNTSERMIKLVYYIGYPLSFYIFFLSLSLTISIFCGCY